jgi:hypothetical protein
MVMKTSIALSLILLLGLCLPTALAQRAEVVYDESPLDYPWSGYVGSSNGISLHIDQFNERGPEHGEISAKIDYDRSKEDEAGLYIESTGDSRRGPGIGESLSWAKKLVFYAKGEHGGEVVRFGYGFPASEYMGSSDSTQDSQLKTLNDSWSPIEFNLTGKDLSHINGLFSFYVSRIDNPRGCTFYIDNITYVG